MFRHGIHLKKVVKAKGVYSVWNIESKLSENPSTNTNLLYVMNEIAARYVELIPEGPPLGYKVMTIFEDTTPNIRANGMIGDYHVGITVTENYWAQLAYQFSHEICHIYTSPIATCWFFESISMMSSLYFLNYLSKKWEKNEDIRFKDYCQSLIRYRQAAISKDLDKLNLQGQNRQTFIKNIDFKNLHHYDRPKQTLIALELLEIFEIDENAWRILPFFYKTWCSSMEIRQGESSVVEDINIQMLADFVPDDLQKTVEKLISVFL